MRCQLRGRRAGRPHLHQGAAQHPRRGRAELRLRPDHRRALHQKAQGRIPLLVRRAHLPRHPARAQGQGRTEKGQEKVKQEKQEAQKQKTEDEIRDLMSQENVEQMVQQVVSVEDAQNKLKSFLGI